VISKTSALLNPYGQKVDPSVGCFWWYALALSVWKRIFLKTKKADQKHCENWWRESGSGLHKTSPMCKRSEWRKQLRDLISQSLKKKTLGSDTISSLFWPNEMQLQDVQVSGITNFLFFIFLSGDIRILTPSLAVFTHGNCGRYHETVCIEISTQPILK